MPKSWKLEDMPKSIRGIQKRLKDPECPPEILRYYATRGYALEVVQNPNCPPDILEMLAVNKNFTVDYHIIRHENVTDEIFQLYLRYGDSDHKRQVAEVRPNLIECSLDLLYKYEFKEAALTYDQFRYLYKKNKGKWARCYLLSNARVPHDLVKDVLKKTKDIDLLLSIIDNLSIPMELAAAAFWRAAGMLEQYKKGYFRKSFGGVVLLPMEKRLSFSILKRDNCPDDILLHLIMSGDDKIKADVVNYLKVHKKSLPLSA